MKLTATGIISLCACMPFWSEARADVTVTESLISAEIVRLGGTTESPSELRLIAFIGKSFTADHFEMMEHTPNVTFVSIINVPAPATAFDSIRHLKKLTNLEIQGGSFTGDGIGKLRRNSELRRVYISNCTLSDTGIKSLSRLRQVSELVLEDIDMPHASLPTLARLEHLKQLTIICDPPVPAKLAERLQHQLPNCKIHIPKVQTGEK